MELWIVRMCREKSQRQLTVCVLALLLGIAFLGAHHRYLSGLLGAPHAMFPSEAVIWLIVAGVFYASVFAGLGVRAWRRLQDVNRNPLIRRVQQWGDPVAMSHNAEQELDIATQFESRGVFITGHYVILKTFLRFNLFRFEDLVWFFARTEYRLIHFVPVGRKHSVRFVFYGGSITFAARRKIVDQVISFAAARSPWPSSDTRRSSPLDFAGTKLNFAGTSNASGGSSQPKLRGNQILAVVRPIRAPGNR
jgi:hypothetical protein